MVDWCEQVNKPASIPVHPCGRYRHNTVVFILAKVASLSSSLPLLIPLLELHPPPLSLLPLLTLHPSTQDHGLKNLRTIHRLDRLTSGLLMFGRSPARAREMETQIRGRQVRPLAGVLV